MSVLVGCSEEDAWPGDEATVQFSTDTLVTYALTGRLFPNADSLSDPMAMTVTADHVLVVDLKGPQPLLVFNRHTGAFITYAGSYGEGPGEVRYVTDLDFKPGHKQGWMLDRVSRSLIFIDVDSLVLTSTLTGRHVALDSAPHLVSAVWSGSDSIVAMGLRPEQGRLAVFSGGGSYVRSAGMAPPGLISTPVPVRQHAYEAMLKSSSDGKRVVAASRHTDRLEIYEDRSLQELIRGPGFHEPVYTVYSNDDTSWLGFEPENIVGYLSVTVTDSLIFGLYSGANYRMAGKDTADSVLVFDWDGRPLAVLKLKGTAYHIAVSPDGGELFALYESPAPLIMRYAVPALL